MAGREFYPGMSLREFARRRHGGSPYLSDARDLRALEDAELEVRSAGSRPGRDGIALPNDERIGVLVREGGPVYYVWLGGYEPECYFEGSLAQCEAALACPRK